MTKSSPFIFGNTVSSSAFTNREADVEKLKNNLLGGINTMLISPRRWGKSSLVEKVIGIISRKEKKTRTVVIDLFSVSNEQEFLETFTREVIRASSNRWQEWLSSGTLFFKKLMPKINIGIDPLTDFSVGFDWSELQKHSEEVLNLPEVIAKKKGIRFIICLDEFQNIAAFSDYVNFEKKMRAVWQRQKLVTYCLYGSKRHMMSDIFNNPSKPFYRFGDIILLQKIEAHKWVSFICKSFASTGKSLVPEDAAIIPRLMKNHSWYVQQLSHYTWNIAPKKAGIQHIRAALTELIQANSPLYMKEVESISATQLNLLKAVTSGEKQFTSTYAMQHYRLGTPQNVSKNKTILIHNDIIQEVDGSYEFVDPAFEIWFRKQYYQQPYMD